MNMGSTRGVWIVGAGARVKDAFLPVLRALGERYVVRGLLARSARELECDGASYSVRTLGSLQQTDLEPNDLVVIAVSKQSVPDVLAQLTRLDVSAIDLLIDTPVVRFRLFHHWKRVLRFRSASVAEDCATLPWIETVKQALAAQLIGDLQEVRFEHSAYAYHAIASAKALVGQSRVASGRRAEVDGVFVRTLRFGHGVRATITEPCRYGEGTLQISGSKGRILDSQTQSSTDFQLRPVVANGLVTGFEVGGVTTELSSVESSLTAGDPPSASIIARQSAMKRVGLFRILQSIEGGAGGYAVEDGLDDMVVDYHLEKLQRYFANPLTSYDSPLARLLFSLATRLGN